MTREEFENYLALVGRLLRLNDQQTQAIGCELRDHLESRVSELVESGVAPDLATRLALEEFGEAAALARRFHQVHFQSQRRWMMRFATLAVAGLFLFSVLIMSMWPDQARFGTPAQTAAQDASGQQESEDPISEETPEHDPFSGETAKSDPFPTESESIELTENHIAEVSSIPRAPATSSPNKPRGKRVVKPTTAPSTTTRENQKIEQALDQLCRFEYDETPFIDVMDDLREHYGFNVLLDTSAKDDSLTEDEPLTFSIVDIPLRDALALMLMEKNATFQIDHGVLKIISLDVADAPEYMRRKIFDCRALLMKMRDPQHGATFNCDVKEPVARLQTLIQKTIEPKGWNVTNGDASIEFVNGLAVVVATETMLKQIEDLLADFEHDLLSDADSSGGTD